MPSKSRPQRQLSRQPRWAVLDNISTAVGTVCEINRLRHEMGTTKRYILMNVMGCCQRTLEKRRFAATTNGAAEKKHATILCHVSSDILERLTSLLPLVPGFRSLRFRAVVPLLREGCHHVMRWHLESAGGHLNERHLCGALVHKILEIRKTRSEIDDAGPEVSMCR